MPPEPTNLPSRQFKSNQWNYRDAEGSGWRITGHPLNAIIDNGRCNLGHEWDEGFKADCGLCIAVRDAMDIIVRGTSHAS